jgi:diguanylate cyclase (GGDEF)-like protein
MHPAYVPLNTFFGSLLVIILVYAENVTNRYSSNYKHTKLFRCLLIAAFVLMLADFLLSLFHGGNQIISMIWPIGAALLLYKYFSIVHKETKVDNLTGFGNRYSFNEFTTDLSRRKTVESWIMVMIDLDETKRINFTYGHLEGDEALRNLASIIKKCSRKTDHVFRYGGDEFVLATKLKYGVEELMKCIKEEVASHNAKKQKPYIIEITYGFDIFTTDKSRSIDDLMKHIDELLCRQKDDRRRTGDSTGGTK